MATEGGTLAGPAPSASRAEHASTRAAAVVLASVAIGLTVQLLFYGVGLGLNLPLAVGAVLAAGWMARDRSRPGPQLSDAWLPAAALLLAAFVAVRGDVTLVALDTIGAVGLTGGALASFGGLRVVQRPLGDLATLGVEVASSAFIGASDAIGAARTWLPQTNLRERTSAAAPVLRGLVMAIPLLLIFAVLFASADAVFGRIAGDLFRWQVDLGSLPGRGLLALAAAWIAAGLLAFVGSAGDARVSTETVAGWTRRPRLGATEAVTVLIALDLLFAAFVLLQGAYLFGGNDTVAASGVTYADYARRGFFELLGVAFAVGGLILALEAFVQRRSRAYLVAAMCLVLLTLVVLASAFLRLRLYQDAYGWTELRFYVLAAICWLAIGSLFALAGLVLDQTRWLMHGMLALSVIFGLSFNAIGPVRYIAERNVERGIHPDLVAPGGETGLDVDYLASLGTDAVTVLADGLPRLPADVQAQAREALRHRAEGLAVDGGGRMWQDWNFSRELARSRLSR